MMAQDTLSAPTAPLLTALQAAAQRVAGAEDCSESETLSAIVAAAADTVPGAWHAGISLLNRDGSITSYGPSNDAIAEVDQLQARCREGPCVTALWDQHTVSVEDLAAETSRWPQFAPQATAAGVSSMLSFQLRARDRSLGALNLYAEQPRSFGHDSQLVGGLFAVHAAIALGEARHVAELQEALNTRDVIGQAKGILMERFRLGADQAFRTLVQSSQETNMKLAAVARWLSCDTDRNSQRP